MYILFFCVCAQYLSADNYLTLSLGAGVPWYLDKVSWTKPSLGTGEQVGIGYMYQRQHFLLQTGIELGHRMTSLRVSSLPRQEYPMFDTEGEYFIYDGDITRCIHRLHTIDVRVPLLLGGEWNRFYFLVGIKGGYELYASTHQTATLVTQGDYDRFYDPLTEMPQHGFSTYAVRGREKTSRNVRCDIYGEFGISFSLQTHNPFLRKKCHVAAFVEVGTIGRRTGTESSLVETDLSRYMSLTLHHVYNTSSVKNRSAHDVMAGVRFTWLIGQRMDVYDCRCTGVD